MKRLRYCFIALLIGAGLAHAQLPPPPANLKVFPIPFESPLFRAGAELTWQIPKILPPVPRSAFRVYRSVDDSLSFKFLDMTDATGYADFTAFAGHTYFYYVTWVWMMPDSSVRESGRSNIAWIQVGPPGGVVTGKIEGTVTDSVSGAPVPHSRVAFFRRGAPYLVVPETISDSLGRYSAVLDTGTYLVLCNPPLPLGRPVMTFAAVNIYKSKWYKDAYDPAHATPVGVTDGGTDVIDFALARFFLPAPAHLKGTVRDSAGNALKGALVVISRTLQEMPLISSAGAPVVDLPGETFSIPDIGCVRGVAWTGMTDSSGAFDAVVFTGRSYIAMAARAGFVPQFFDHKNTPAEATIIRVSGDTSGFDFNLNPFRPPHMYTLGGDVRDSSGVMVPSRIIVFPLRPFAARAARFAFTDSLGAYTVGHLLAGKYIVLAVPFGPYAPAFYKAGAFGVIRWKDADTVTVAGNVAGIDIGVVRIHCTGVATLSGVVTSGGAALEGVNVVAQDAGGNAVGYGVTDGAGAYQIDALPEGALTLTADLPGYDGAGENISVGASQFALTQDFSLSVTTSLPSSRRAPQAYALEQNFPNPFNPSTRIEFVLPAAGSVNLRVFNLLGQEVATILNGPVTAGDHVAVWDGRDAAGRGMSSGVYFYRIDVRGSDGASTYSAVRKMLLVK